MRQLQRWKDTWKTWCWKNIQCKIFKSWNIVSIRNWIPNKNRVRSFCELLPWLMVKVSHAPVGLKPLYSKLLHLARHEFSVCLVIATSLFSWNIKEKKGFQKCFFGKRPTIRQFCFFSFLFFSEENLRKIVPMDKRILWKRRSTWSHCHVSLRSGSLLLPGAEFEYTHWGKFFNLFPQKNSERIFAAPENYRVNFFVLLGPGFSPW